VKNPHNGISDDGSDNEADDNHSVRIERIENVKDVRNYILRIDEMIDRKKKFFEENNF
jgi:hypothetical protein